MSKKTPTPSRARVPGPAPADRGRKSPAGEVRKRRKNAATTVWGESIKTDDFVAVPRALIWLGRHDRALRDKIEARHLWFLLALAARKYRKKPICVYWQSLATDLGVPPSTARRWGYELRDLGLLTIRNRRKGKEPVSAADPSVLRNDRNEFSFEQLEAHLQTALESRERARADAKRRRRISRLSRDAPDAELAQAAEEETNGVAP